MKNQKILLFSLIALLFISACSIQSKVKCANGEEVNHIKKCQEEIEKVAERFARFWEQKDYALMYNMFIPELQKIKSKEDFIETLEFEEKERNVVVRFDKVSKDNDTTAYVYYTITSSLFNSRAPAMKLEFRDSDWRVDAFATYFNEDIKKVKRNAKVLEFIKKATEFRSKSTEISRDSLYTLKLFNIRADSEYCIDFGSQALRTKDIIEEYQKLDVPTEFSKVHSLELEAYNFSYNMNMETKAYCDVVITNEHGMSYEIIKEALQHLNNAQKFDNLTLNRTLEAQALLKSLNASIFQDTITK
ncbi:hypothetical protein HYY71_03375 [Candidatus Woesearchaeota archaeon]|nr:hypothetical protein [Candidatus Woesearchaeota archaeon]